MGKSSRIISLLLAGVMTAGLLGGCSGESTGTTDTKTEDTKATETAAESNSEIDPALVNTELSGEITQWVWGDYEIRGASEFNKYYPNIKVNYVSVPSDEYEQKILITLASGGEMPDVINIESAARGKLNNMDVLERLDAAPYHLDQAEVLDIGIPLMSSEQGEIVCVQVDNCVGGYAYDRNLAKQYFGTDDPAEMEKKFASLDDFVEAGKLVAEQSGGKVFMFSGVEDAYSAVNALYKEEAFVTDGKLTVESSILPTYQFIEKMVANNSLGEYVSWTPAWYTSFASNDVIFYPAPAWFISFMMKPNDPDSEAKWGFMTPPGGGFNNGGTAYGIPKAAKEENKELAWAYIKWLTLSQEGAESFMAAHDTPTLYAPAYDTDLYGGRPDPFFAGQNVTEKIIEISRHPNTIARPITQYDLTIKDCNALICKDLEAGMSGEEAFAKLKKEIIAKAPELAE